MKKDKSAGPYLECTKAGAVKYRVNTSVRIHLTTCSRHLPVLEAGHQKQSEERTQRQQWIANTILKTELQCGARFDGNNGQHGGAKFMMRSVPHTLVRLNFVSSTLPLS